MINDDDVVRDNVESFIYTHTHALFYFTIHTVFTVCVFVINQSMFVYGQQLKKDNDY